MYTFVTRTLRFKLNNPLKISITLPNGEPVRFNNQNNPPKPPNPLLQISAIFSLDRISDSLGSVFSVSAW